MKIVLKKIIKLKELKIYFIYSLTFKMIINLLKFLFYKLYFKNKTLCIIKPDIIERNLQNEIINRIQDEGFKIINEIRKEKLTRYEAEKIYKEHKNKEFFDRLINFMTRDYVIVLVLKKKNAIKDFRNLILKLRKTYALSARENSIHGSDSEKSFLNEISVLDIKYKHNKL